MPTGGTRPVIDRIIDVDDEGRPSQLPDRLTHGRRKLTIDDDGLRFTVLEHERDRRCVEPGVQRVQHGAGHRDAVVRLDHLRSVRQHHRDGIAALDARAPERMGQLP